MTATHRRSAYIVRIRSTASALAITVLLGGLVPARLAAATLPGLPDTSFDGDGRARAFFDFGGALIDRVEAVATQPDGKIVVVGWGHDGTDTDGAMARFLPNGALDPTFGTGGKVREMLDFGGANNDFFEAVGIQPDGKIVVAATTDRVAGHSDIIVLRYNADGTLDTGFGTFGQQFVAFDLGGSNNDLAAALEIDSTGRITVAGTAASATVARIAVARLLFDGSFDLSFSVDGKQTFATVGEVFVRGLAVGPFGAPIYVVGNVLSNPGGQACLTAKLLWNGELDIGYSGGILITHFNLGGSNSDMCHDVAIQPDGRIVLGISATVDAADNRDFFLQRRFDDATWDGSFGGTGLVQLPFDLGTAGNTDDALRAIALQADGAIVVGGTVEVGTNERVFGFTRVRPDGTVDTTFGIGGKMVMGFDVQAEDDDDMAALTLDAGGRIVAAGTVDMSDSNNDTDFGVAVLTNDYIFVDGFEWEGTTGRWSTTVP